MPFEDQLIIDSRDRNVNSNSPTDFTINIPYASGTANTWELVNIIIPLVYDNVGSINNTITTPAVTIPIGHYNINDLLIELNVQTSGTYTWSWENNERITLTRDDLAIFTFDGGTCNNLLGVDTTVNHTGANTYTFEYFPNLAEGFEYFTLHSDILSRRSVKEIYLSNKKASAISLIPLQRFEHGQVFSWEPENKVKFDIKNQHLSLLDFQLRNKIGDIVDLNNRTITLVFDRIK